MQMPIGQQISLSGPHLASGQVAIQMPVQSTQQLQMQPQTQAPPPSQSINTQQNTVSSNFFQVKVRKGGGTDLVDDHF